MDSLTIDLSQLKTTIKTYDKAITDFQNSFDNLDKAIDTLKNSGWQSGASTQYFSLYDSSWKANMQRHLQIMQHLKSCLDNAEEEYVVLYEWVHKLGQNL